MIKFHFSQLRTSGIYFVFNRYTHSGYHYYNQYCEGIITVLNIRIIYHFFKNLSTHLIILV